MLMVSSLVLELEVRYATRFNRAAAGYSNGTGVRQGVIANGTGVRQRGEKNSYFTYPP